MKITKNGKEVKNATVVHNISGQPELVRVDGVDYDASAFEFEQGETVKKTKPASTKTKKRGLKDRLSGALSTKDVKRGK